MTVLEFLEECKKLTSLVASSGCKILSTDMSYNLCEQEAHFAIKVRFAEEAAKPDVVVEDHND